MSLAHTHAQAKLTISSTKMQQSSATSQWQSTLMKAQLATSLPRLSPSQLKRWTAQPHLTNSMTEQRSSVVSSALTIKSAPQADLSAQTTPRSPLTQANILWHTPAQMQASVTSSLSLVKAHSSAHPVTTPISTTPQLAQATSSKATSSNVK